MFINTMIIDKERRRTIRRTDFKNVLNHSKRLVNTFIFIKNDGDLNHFFVRKTEEGFI